MSAEKFYVSETHQGVLDGLDLEVEADERENQTLEILKNKKNQT